MKCTNFRLLSLPIVLITAVYIVFLALTLINGYQTLVTWRRVSSIKQSSSEDDDIPFSIIICAHNELGNLQLNLPSILNQNYASFEVIVGLDRCTDGSIEYIQSLKAGNLTSVIIKKTPPGWNSKKYVLSKCIEKASHEWLLLTDADCQPVSENWIKSYALNIHNKINLVLGVSPYQQSNRLTSFITEYETFMTASSYLSAAANKSPYMGVGRNLAYTKSLYKSINGFEGIEHITGGDDDLLVQKMVAHAEVSINIHPESLTYSAPERTWKKYLTQKTRHLSVGKDYQEKFKQKLSTSAVLHSSLWLSFLYLIGFSDTIWRIIVPFALLVLIKGLFFKKIATKIGTPLRLIWYPIMDLVYAVFLPLIAIRAMLERNIRWKK